MEYLFLRRKKTSSTSVRQKTLLYRAAGREWTARFSSLSDVRPADSLIYKGILYQLEIRRAFLDSSLSLKKLSMMLETNQTYLSNAVNRYFGCHLKELLNRSGCNTLRSCFATAVVRWARFRHGAVSVRRVLSIWLSSVRRV